MIGERRFKIRKESFGEFGRRAGLSEMVQYVALEAHMALGLLQVALSGVQILACVVHCCVPSPASPADVLTKDLIQVIVPMPARHSDEAFFRIGEIFSAMICCNFRGARL